MWQHSPVLSWDLWVPCTHMSETSLSRLGLGLPGRQGSFTGSVSLIRPRILPGQGLCLPHQAHTPGDRAPLRLCPSHAKWPPASAGIQTTVVFWPAKLQVSGRVVMFRFEFWDCGESALRKFDHMLPVSRRRGGLGRSQALVV